MKRIIAGAAAAMVAGLTFSPLAFAQNWWDGPEIGIQGGYGFGTSSGHISTLPNGYNFGMDGAMGGAHAGYDWQNGPWVLGIEGDIEGGDIGGLHRNTTTVPTHSIGEYMDFDASVRGKVGFAFDRVLLYGTGGVAFGDVTTHYNSPIGTRSVPRKVCASVGPAVLASVTPSPRIGKAISNIATPISARRAIPSPAAPTTTTNSTTT